MKLPAGLICPEDERAWYDEFMSKPLTDDEHDAIDVFLDTSVWPTKDQTND
jgi:hypothetical protein|tara:strand:+ start:25567 stop:25719 length:153 start_codon:yes stop_codon:yes gene_type:complete